MHRTPKLVLLCLSLASVAAEAPPKPASPAAAAPAAPDDAPQPLAIAVAPGPAKEAVRKTLLLPYATATATALGDPAWDGSVTGLGVLQAGHLADLVLLDGHTLAVACQAQTVDRIDWSALGRERYVPMAASDCGVGAYVSATVLAWDTEKFSGTPSWGDFWDVAKHPGRRGLRRTARGNLEIALLADGVSAGDVYRVLRSSDGVDRAFRKLDQLKPYVIWWDQAAQPAQLLASAKVLLTSAPATALPSGSKTHVGVQWSGSLSEAESWARPANAAHGSAAVAALLVASDAARQVKFSRMTGLGPAVRGALPLLPHDARAQNPSLPANLQAGLAIDEGFWLDSDKLETRFTAWLGK